jgi:DNA (cytosine-5)-methyltransferase 1
MVYGSVCSGIEAASVAWEPLGWRAAFFSEIEAFPRAVLHHRFPHVPLHGDFTTIEAGEGFDASEDGTGRGTPLVPVAFSAKDHGADAAYDCSPTLRAMGHATSHANGGGQVAVAFQSSQSGVRVGETHATLDANNGSRRHNGIALATAVRRLTPRECERLQGFPDDYTAISWRGKPAAECPDGPRYKALGNSMAVPVVRWIGRRIAMVDAILKENAK